MSKATEENKLTVLIKIPSQECNMLKIYVYRRK